MGGNVTAMMKDGTATRAEKIPVAEIGRPAFIAKIREFLKKFNEIFKKEYGQPIWIDEKDILSGFIFNGSSSFIMDPSLPDEEVVKVKQSAGDLDITVPEELKADVWKLLDKYEGKEIVKGVTYMGSNRPTIQSIGEQINAVFVISFGDLRCNCQVDFEFLPYEDGKPTEWAKFSHSSSFEDAKIQVKAVHHKYLIRAMVGGASLRKDIVICTSTSTPDNIKLSKSKEHIEPRMLKFSVGRGIRVAYEPMLNNGQQVYMDGKMVYKVIPSNKSDYITSVVDIFKISFGDPAPSDVNKFSSFAGVIDLMAKYLTKEQIKSTVDRYLSLLWAVSPQRAQELEVGNPELDYDIKMSGYQYISKKLKLKNNITKMVDAYYKDYGQRKSNVGESFIEWLERTQAFLLPGEEL